MTIWNALAAGGALWFAGLAISAARVDLRNRYDVLGFHAAYVLLCAGFGLCLWGAIP